MNNGNIQRAYDWEILYQYMNVTTDIIKWRLVFIWVHDSIIKGSTHYDFTR